MTNQNAQIKRAVKLALRREKRKSDLQEKFFPWNMPTSWRRAFG